MNYYSVSKNTHNYRFLYSLFCFQFFFSFQRKYSALVKVTLIKTDCKLISSTFLIVFSKKLRIINLVKVFGVGVSRDYSAKICGNHVL